MNRRRRPRGPASTDINFDLPEGWKQVTPSSAITKAAFRAGEGDKLEITITVLGGPAGGFANNVNRWRGQIKLPKASEDDLTSALKDVSVDGAVGKLVDSLVKAMTPNPSWGPLCRRAVRRGSSKLKVPPPSLRPRKLGSKRSFNRSNCRKPAGSRIFSRSKVSPCRLFLPNRKPRTCSRTNSTKHRSSFSPLWHEVQRFSPRSRR